MVECNSYIILNLDVYKRPKGKFHKNMCKLFNHWFISQIDPWQHLFFHLFAALLLSNFSLRMQIHIYHVSIYIASFWCLLVLLSLTDVRCYFEHAKASERLQSFLFSLHSLISGKASYLSVTQSDCSCQLCTKRNQFGSGDTSIFLLSLKQTRFDC